MEHRNVTADLELLLVSAILFVSLLGLNLILYARGEAIRSRRSSLEGIKKYLNASSISNHLLPLYIYVLRFLAIIYFIQLLTVFFIYKYPYYDDMELTENIHIVIDMIQNCAWDFVCCVLLQPGIGPKSVFTALKIAVAFFVPSALFYIGIICANLGISQYTPLVIIFAIRSMALLLAKFKCIFRLSRKGFYVLGIPYLVFQVAEAISMYDNGIKHNISIDPDHDNDHGPDHDHDHEQELLLSMILTTLCTIRPALRK